jgi:Ca2+-binding RTX toxin-like protein
MAKLSTRVALDMDDWILDDIVGGDLGPHNGQRFVVEGDGSRTYDFGGRGFDYLEILDIGIPIAGTVKSLNIAEGGNNTLTLTGISIDIPTLYGFLGGEQYDSLVVYLFANDDSIRGSDFADILRGEAGDDVIKAGAGADKLNGGPGIDKLKGGAGADSFFYAGAFESAGVAHDRVIDFNAAEDVFIFDVAVTGVDAAIVAGRLSQADFDSDLADAADDGHLGANHAVLFTPDSGKYAGETFLVVDLNGEAGYDVGEDAVIRLTETSGLGGLSAANFLAD